MQLGRLPFTTTKVAMSAFESKVDSSSDSGDRSRSEHRIGGATTKVVTSSDSSMSTAERKKGSERLQGSNIGTVAEGSSSVFPPVLPLCAGMHSTEAIADQVSSVNQSPDGTLSQFIHSPESQEQLVPTFSRGQQVSSSSAGPVGFPAPEGGATFVQNNQTNVKQEFSQTQVRNELHVSMDPFIIAQANQAFEQSRANILSQAQVALDQSREQLREEATQFAEQAQEAARVEAISAINQVQSEAQSEVNQVFQRAQDELAEVKRQASTEIARIKAEAQKQMARLEGRITELTYDLSRVGNDASLTVASLEQRISNMMQESDRFRNIAQRMLDEREGAICSLTSRVGEQNKLISELRATISRMQDSAMRRPFNADNGAEVRIHTPEGLHAAGLQTTIHGPNLEAMPAFGYPSMSQDLQNRKTGEQPSGSAGRRAKRGGRDKGIAKEGGSSQPVHTMISELKSALAQLEQRVSRSPSVGNPSEGGSPSSFFSFSQLWERWGRQSRRIQPGFDSWQQWL